MVWCTVFDYENDKRKEQDLVPPKQYMAADANTFLDHFSKLNVNSDPSNVRLTGIICTIGPSTVDVPVLEKLMESGMNIARLICRHSNKETLLKKIENIRIAADNYSRRLGTTFPVGIALDIKGPEIRLGNIEAEDSKTEVELISGDQFKLTTDKAYLNKGNAGIMYVDYDNIHKCVQTGNRIYLDDGHISLICTSVQGSILTFTIESGGFLGSGKSVNLAGIETDLPQISQEDKDDIRFGLENNVDMIFASFVTNAAPINEIRDMIRENESKQMIIAKIENQKGLANIDEIIKVSDGILIGRGDLGVELPVEKLFIAQKYIVAKCNIAGKPVICANQLLESMIKKSRPTRAESTDVANAILDGVDCLLLRNESAIGDYPVESVLTLTKMCKEAEAVFWYKLFFGELLNKIAPPLEPSHAVAIAAVEIAAKCVAAAIIVITTSGRSAFLAAKYRPYCPILAVTRNDLIARQLHLYRGVIPLFYNIERIADWSKDVEARISFAISFGKWRRFIKNGDPVVVLHGSKRGSGHTDTLRILYVTKPPAGDEPCECNN